jgi:hypothetical protein
MKTKQYPAAITLAYEAIMRSNVFRLDGPPIDLPRALTLLGNAVHGRETDEFIWSSLGEFTEAPLGDLIVGAYWALTEWHGGQASPSYAAMCSLGQVFKPGCASGPEPDSGESSAYEMVNEWFALNPRR